MAGHVHERDIRGITEIIADRNTLVSPLELNIGQGNIRFACPGRNNGQVKKKGGGSEQTRRLDPELLPEYTAHDPVGEVQFVETGDVVLF